MRKKKPLFVVFVAIALVWALPISSSADFAGGVSPYASQLGEFTYNGVHVDASKCPWYHLKVRGYGDNSNTIHEKAGRIHYPSAKKAFLLWIPFFGFYLVCVGGNSLSYDLAWGNDSTHHAIYTNYGEYFNPTANQTNPAYFQSYASYYGDGYLSSSNKNLFQTYLFGNCCLFYYISMGNYSNRQNPPSDFQASATGITEPTPTERDAILDFIGDNSGQDLPFPDPRDVEPTFISPSGTNVTNPYGQPVSTFPNGEPIPTYPSGEPVETYTQHGNTKIYTVPYDSDSGEPYTTIVYGSSVYVVRPDETVVTDPDTGQVLPDPDDPSKPWIESVTIYNEENQISDINEQFGKINSMIADLDDLSSVMESYGDDLSGHVDDTRDLIDDVTNHHHNSP